LREPLRRISEEFTRKELIDPPLEQAGWYLRDHSGKCWQLKMNEMVKFIKE
jgi:type I site-specific restriction endonuclease